LKETSWPVAAKVVAELYAKNAKPVEKTEEEIKDEAIKVKPALPTGCGRYVDLYG
jgi:hypothetical protein